MIWFQVLGFATCLPKIDYFDFGDNTYIASSTLPFFSIVPKTQSQSLVETPNAAYGLEK